MIKQKYFSLLITLFITLGFLSVKKCFSHEVCKPKVAIIGAGIGGASASHFLTELFDKNIEIDVFESKTVGGRLATVAFGNEEFEAGGAIIHPRNKYMKDFVKLLNLEHRPPSGGNFGIWNGKEFVFEESNWETITLFKLLYRYGLQSIHLHRYVSAILDDFEIIYDLQDKRIGFENVTSLLYAMNEQFPNLLQVSIKDHLSSLGYEDKIINELVEATLVVNYGQDVNVHSFVSCVSVAGAGFDLWSVKGGNKEVPKNLISSNKNVKIGQSIVQKIHRQLTKSVPKYEIFFKEEDKDKTDSKLYDIVIIAAPMTHDQEFPIKFQGFETKDLKFVGEYQTTFATFVKGNVDPSYFGLKEELGGIMSCNPEKTIISSVGQLTSVEGTKDNHSKIYKVFSRKRLDDSILNEMFSNVDEVNEIKWKAYPNYSSTQKFNNFKLDDYMYYVNAIEWAASAMEMSAIGGRNTAILAYNDYQKQCSSESLNNQSDDKSTQTHSPEL